MWIRKKLSVRTLGDRVLREKASAIAMVDDRVRGLADSMIKAMHRFNGIGLAAPQVGESLRLVVLDVPYPDKDAELSAGEEALLPMMPLVVVNPEIIASSSTLAAADEGCLSIPGIFAPVLRPERVVFRAQLLDGSTIQYECGGLLGRCLQHELDHLDGVVFTDRVAPEAKAEISADLDALEAFGARCNYRR